MSYKTWLCRTCGYVYNEELGDEEHGLVAGTKWQDIAEDWICPDCGVAKSDFEMTEI